jgi:protoheme ferro-lyase
MRTLKEIADEIRETRKEMKAKRVRRISCFNGGLTADERQFNQRLFNLETERRTVAAYLQAQK